jgi:hypothetical protein
MSQGFLADILSSRPDIAAHLGAADPEPEKRPVRMATCFRVMHLSRPAEAPRGETLVFAKEDSAALLKMLTSPPVEGALVLDDIASCDARVVQSHPLKVVVELGLSVSSDRLDSGFDHLISKGFTTAKGLRLLASEAAPPRKDVLRPRICRVLSRAPAEEVSAAFVHRGVPEESILQVTADTVGQTGVQTRTKQVHLVHGFPMNQIPWKVALQEPGYALGPCSVAIEGNHCSVCRQQGHKSKKCPSRKEQLCGRCSFPLEAISDENRKAFNHDCEGGPEGYGAAHADPSGLAWHRLFLQHRASSAAPAEVADPLAEVRAQSLESARAAAQVALERRKAKKAKQNARQGLSGDTPPAKKQQLSAEMPQLNL